MNRKIAGFTLIELMIAVIVISILAAIGVPAYRDYVSKSRRADAKAGLLSLQLAEEKYRANCPQYAGTIGSVSDCGTGTVKHSGTSPDGYYNLSVVSWTATSYTLQATPATGPQLNDKCGDYQINQNGLKMLPNYTYPTTLVCGW